ncbi:ROK family protein [Kitasatospora viridis]|uniref:Glucokinase n=1 Tax=Kitasatospora viridis TaxID=281105 RepID=A0A561T7I7_9ACTN|nr:ROK family protein [Kitasatospora viridis]TWF83074.1 glucokinase [Kitasatospora viridis]
MTLHQATGTPDTPLAAALDIGGTKIAAGLVSATGELIHRHQVPTPATAAAHTVFAAVAEALDALTGHPLWERVGAIGVGSAGPVDARRGTVSPVNIPHWRDFPLVEQVRKQPGVGERPVVLGGDAVAMAAAEHWRGAAREYRDALCIVVSTGVGAGLVLDGRVRPGPSGNAGHLGHISLDPDGDPCPCGSRGCLEGLASGTAIARRAREAGWHATGDGSAAAVAEAARAGDPVALAAFDRAARALAVGIANTAALVDLEAVVIGGGVAQSGELFLAPLRRHLADYATLSYTRDLAVLPAALGTDAGVIGAAALAFAND